MAELYKGIAGSPITYLVGDISANQTTISIADDSALPDAPNIATIGYGEQLETIKYGIKSNGVLQEVVRGVEGIPRAWQSGTEVARFFTAYDHLAIIDGIAENADNLTTHLAENVYEKEVHGLEIEEGIWTPSFYFASVPGNHTLSAANGSYYKIGKLVTIYFYVVVSAFDSSASGTVRIGNLPFPAKSNLFPVNFSDLRNIEHPSTPLGSMMGSIADATGLSIVISHVAPDGTFRYLNSLYFHDGSVIRGGLTYFTD